MALTQQQLRMMAALLAKKQQPSNALYREPPRGLLNALNKPLPMEGRFGLLPIKESQPGMGPSVFNKRELALPGLLAGAVNAFTAPGRAMSGPPGFKPEEEAVNFTGNFMGGGLLGSKMAPPPRGSVGMNAFHGSPHKFDAFDLSKVGTGEGAQAYGHGLYLAESKAVGQGYQTQISNDLFSVGDGSVFDPASLGHMNVRTAVRKGDLDAAIARAREIAGSDSPVANLAAQDMATLQGLKAKGGISKHAGYLYHVDVPDEAIGKMLDWDKPLSDQPAAVRSALMESGVVKELGLAVNHKGNPVKSSEVADELILTADNDSRLYQDKTLYGAIEAYKKNPANPLARRTILSKIRDYPFDDSEFGNFLDELEAGKGAVTAGEMHDALVKKMAGNQGLERHEIVRGKGDAQKKVADYLKGKGVTGIRYLDQGSRADGNGTRNFVLFDDKLAKIKKRE
jgi:hypothetical protein